MRFVIHRPREAVEATRIPVGMPNAGDWIVIDTDGKDVLVLNSKFVEWYRPNSSDVSMRAYATAEQDAKTAKSADPAEAAQEGEATTADAGS